MKKFYYILFLLFPVLTLVGCTDEDGLDVGENQFVLNYTVRMSDDVLSRAVGDGSHVDELIVGVFEKSGEEYTEVGRFLGDKNEDDNSFTVDIALFKNTTYHLLFWAQKGETTAYSLDNSGIISVEYADYKDKGFSGTNDLDAFYATSTVEFTDKSEAPAPVTLHRPFAQLNFADKTAQPEQGNHQAVVTYCNLPKSFNPFSGEVVETDENEMTFIFTDFPDETLDANGESYYYVASNYFFAPANEETTIEAVLDWQQADGTSINEFEFKDDKAIVLEQNKRTNVFGTIVQQPQVWSEWDGNIPTISTLTTDSENQNRYIIDEANDVAWLSVKENAQNLATNSTFVMTVNVDMNNGSGLAPIQLPSGSTFDGNRHTIKGLQLGNALLGDVTDITVENLTIEETTVANTSADVTHVGVLVNRLKGSNTFSNIHIKSSSVSTQNGAAGGIVGYISRKDPNNREETLTVTFDNCHVTETTIDGTRSEGYFVGLLCGYDYNETLQFNSNCTLTLSATARSADGFVSPYREGNEGAWLADNDYSKYDGWLGNEECYRGTVMYGDNRFIPCWDGVTKITPLTEESTKLIYSAFDLASLQGSAHTAVTFKENVDLGGDRTTNKNPFTPISAINRLDGENYKLYNLNIYHKSWIVGFINGTNVDNTEHKNLHFVNSSVRANMNGDEAQVYVGTLCPYVQKKYKVENITIDNGYVLGLGKLGGLIGYVTPESTASLDCSNCTITSSKIENIKGTAEETFIVVKFNPHGEAGGLVGFIQNTATISNCKVTNCEIDCYGQKDKWLLITIPGRHVNDFIGDIRLDGGQRIDLINNTVSNNSFTNGKKDTHSNDCPIVGKCYNISGMKGTVYIGSTRVF